MRALLLALALIGCGTSTPRRPWTMRLETLEECERSVETFCRRSVAPWEVCARDLREMYCAEQPQ